MSFPVFNYNMKAFFAINIYVFIIFAFSAMQVSAQNQYSADEDTSYNNNTIFLPALSSSPETSFLFGGVAVRQFKPEHAGINTQPSSLVVSALYTLNNQLLIGINPYLVMPGETWIFEGRYAFNYFPENFWGIGPNTRDNDEMQMEYRQFYIEQAALKKIRPALFVGPRIRWTQTYDMSFEDTDGNSIPSPAITGAKGYTSSGIGINIRLDRRNSTMTPTENYAVDFSSMINPTWLGSTKGYTSWQLDARRYFNFSKGNSVLALQAITRLTSGTPPLKDMATLGGESILRGYYGGRFRDYNGLQLQAEIRQHLVGRLGITSFVSTGEVWHSFNDFTLEHTKWTAGGGLRFNLNRKDPMNLRLDYGFGENTSGLYLTLGEAF